MVDNDLELIKIKELFSKVKVVIRIRCDVKNSPMSLGAKFGCIQRGCMFDTVCARAYTSKLYTAKRCHFLLNVRDNWQFIIAADEKYLSNIWKRTADSADSILKDVLLPELYMGDWLVWKNMGAYTLALSNTFNGFPIPDEKLLGINPSKIEAYCILEDRNENDD